MRALEVLSRSQYFWKVDPEIIYKVKERIVRNQQEDGHFHDITSKTLEDKVAVTAETIAVFTEIGLDEVCTLVKMKFSQEPL